MSNLQLADASTLNPQGILDSSRRLTFGSVCSGIESASEAWVPLGWQPKWYAEIDPFCSAVLAAHHPGVHNYGDFTQIDGHAADIDVLVGGTPCQSFSLAGLRGGLSDSRGNLALEYLRLADRLRPKWLVWENVPGVFSSVSHDAPDPRCPPDPLDLERDGQEMVFDDEYDAVEVHAFNCFLAGLSELGYGFAYRVLDAQYCGVPQHRRRVFVVGHIGDWRRPAATLFESASLSWNPPPSYTPREGAAAAPAGRADTRGFRQTALGEYVDDDTASAIKHRDYKDHTDLIVREVCHAFGVPPDRVVGALPSGGTPRGHGTAGVNDQAVDAGHVIATGDYEVRSLTAREYERLMGFRDDYTLITYNGRPATDGPRKRALGNSIAIPCMRWIGDRIQLVEVMNG